MFDLSSCQVPQKLNLVDRVSLASLPRITSRFVPSPTGYLHLGHLYALLCAWQFARDFQGKLVLRIDDLDQERCHSDYVQAIFEDLEPIQKATGLTWYPPVLYAQSQSDFHQRAFDALQKRDLLYPCFCSRKDVRQELARISAAPHKIDRTHYPGTCRKLSLAMRKQKIDKNYPHCWRLDAAKAWAYLQKKYQDGTNPLSKNAENIWDCRDVFLGLHQLTPADFQDIILRRRDGAISYHLAVICDDYAQNVTLVTRGEDLWPMAPVQKLLALILDYPPVIYAHHPLICDAAGQRLAKRYDSLSLRSLYQQGITAKQICEKLGSGSINNMYSIVTDCAKAL